MADITFNPDQPIQSLSGAYGNLVFRTLRSGRTVVHTREFPTLIDECVGEIQVKMASVEEAIEQRKAIKLRVTRLYKALRAGTDDDGELKKRILMAYYQTRRKLPSRSDTTRRKGKTRTKPELDLHLTT